MPLSSEIVSNKPLTGLELVKCILNDTEAVLNKDGMFNSHVAYGRVTYEVTVKLSLQNPTYPEHIARAKGEAGDPASLGGEVQGVEISRKREIKSPNVARIANDLPVKIQTRQDGKVVEKDLNYKGEVDLPPQPEPIDSIKRT